MYETRQCACGRYFTALADDWVRCGSCALAAREEIQEEMVEVEEPANDTHCPKCGWELGDGGDCLNCTAEAFPEE